MNNNFLSDLMLYLSGRDSEIVSEDDTEKDVVVRSSNSHWSPFEDIDYEDNSLYDNENENVIDEEEDNVEPNQSRAIHVSEYSWARPEKESGFLVPNDFLDEEE